MRFLTDAQLAELLAEDARKRRDDLATAAELQRDLDLMVGRFALVLLAWFLFSLFGGRLG